jgi:hypothetical protein
MANIVSLNTSIVVDTDETCTLNVSNLATLIQGSDAYFGDSSNWSAVQVEYRSSTSRQREIITINPTVGTGIFRVSAKARQEGWVIHEIRVRDFDGDIYKVKKSDMIVTDYDEPTISGGAPSYPYVVDMTGTSFPSYFSITAGSIPFTFDQSFDELDVALGDNFGTYEDCAVEFLIDDGTANDYKSVAGAPALDLTSHTGLQIDLEINSFGLSLGDASSVNIFVHVHNEGKTATDFSAGTANFTSGGVIQIQIPKGNLTNVGNLVGSIQVYFAPAGAYTSQNCTFSIKGNGTQPLTFGTY